MTRASRGWHLLALAAGLAVLALPILRELGPRSFPARSLELTRFLALLLALVLASYWAGVAATASTMQCRFGAAVAVGVAVGTGLWALNFLGSDAMIFLEATPAAVLASGTLIGITLLTSWRVAGLSLTGVTIAIICLFWLGQFVPATGIPASTAGGHLLYLTFGSSGIYGVPLDIMANMVLVFVIFGTAFEVAGCSAAISAVAIRLSARSPSSAIKACVLASGMLGTISGAVSSNVVTSGSFTIPSMRKIGVPNATAAGIEAASSTGGQIMPPVLGIAAFLLADLVGVPYATVVLASIGPALAIYLAFFRQADRVPLSPSNSHQAEAAPKLQRAWLIYLLPPSVIVAILMQADILVSTAAILGTASCLPIALYRVGWRDSVDRLRKAFPALLATSLNLMIIAATVGLLLGAISGSGLTGAGAILIGRLGDSNLALALILTAGSAFLLGMGVATAGIYILGGTLLAPGLITAGVPPLAAHFFVLYSGILSMITPPVAFASLAASALAGAPFGATSRAAIRFGWILFVMPFLIVLQPGILLIGTALEIVTAYTAIAAFVMVATSTALPSKTPQVGGVGLVLAMIYLPGPAWLLALSAAALVGESFASRSPKPVVS